MSRELDTIILMTTIIVTDSWEQITSAVKSRHLADCFTQKQVLSL